MVVVGWFGNDSQLDWFGVWLLLLGGLGCGCCWVGWGVIVVGWVREEVYYWVGWRSIEYGRGLLEMIYC